MPQKQLPVSPEEKKVKKESKGEIQISHKEVPPPACKVAELKLRVSALLFQLPFVSGPGTFVYLLIDRLPFAFISSFVGKTQSSPRFPFTTSASSLYPDSEDGRGSTSK
jgi:hypothetical protein